MGVASISKTFVGAAMLRAVEQGQLALDVDIGRWLPFDVANPHRPDAVITLRHLATHTSGIVDRAEVYAGTYHYGDAEPEPLARFLQDYLARGGGRHAEANFVDADPGTQREYANIGAALAGYIIERATGRPLQAYAREHIFGRLGMQATTWSPEPLDRRGHTTHYVSHNGMAVPIPPYRNTTYPDGGVHTSADDLAKFFIALLNDGVYRGTRILDAASVRELRRMQFDDTNRPHNFPASEGNSGLFWRTKRNGTLLGHGGTDPGIMAEMLTDPEGRIGVIVFSNTSLHGDEQLGFVRIVDEVWQLARLLDASSTRQDDAEAQGAMRSPR
jgi:CubicO group peptidase (beta-lactamase class C family)